MSITILRSAPDWEKSCWVVALRDTTKTTEAQIKKLAKKNDWDGKSSGLTIEATIRTAWDIIGHMPDLSFTRKASGMTPKSVDLAAPLAGRTGLVFTNKHVMPCVHGRLSNFNGYGDDKVVAVAVW